MRRNRLVEKHLWLVRRERARLLRRLPPSIDADQLLSDGQLALLLAAERFDPSHGVPFRAYASARILNGMIDGLRRRSGRGRRSLSQTELRSRIRPESVAIPDPSLAGVDCADEVANLLDGVSPRRQLLLKLYYVQQLSMRQIAQDLRITEARVSQLIRDAQRTLRRDSPLRKAA